MGRNTMRGPGVTNLDLSLFRTFKLTEQFNLQFRAEAFNATQHAAFRQPERQRQQLELREGPRHADRLCHRPVSRVPLRPAFGLLVSRGDRAAFRAISASFDRCQSDARQPRSDERFE